MTTTPPPAKKKTTCWCGQPRIGDAPLCRTHARMLTGALTTIAEHVTRPTDTPRER